MNCHQCPMAGRKHMYPRKNLAFQPRYWDPVDAYLTREETEQKHLYPLLTFTTERKNVS